MIIIRPIQRKDLIIRESFSDDSLLGMTNLSCDQDQFLEKILISEKSFSQLSDESAEGEYYFVLEDLSTGEVGGICGIIAQSLQSFRYCYRIETHLTHGKEGPTPKEIKILKVVSNRSDSSEVCALYLHPSYRHSGLGKLLSFSRFLFIAAHPFRFRENIVAEMRGYIDENQTSPFWEGIGKHFCDMTFKEIMHQIEIDHYFLPEILPQYPIYISLLPKAVQESIGRTHDSTKPAYKMLMGENFTFRQEVDIFEGGPIMTARKEKIRSICESKILSVEITHEEIDNDEIVLLGNEKLDFRACYGPIKMNSENHAILKKETADALEVGNGDKIRIVKLIK